MLATIASLVLGYLIGSIPSGVIVTKMAGAADPRGVGSGNIGATNVLRTGRKDLAAVTLVMDAMKGTLPVLIARGVADPASSLHLAMAAACGAFLGHLFPLFLSFRGGKGVATFLGCLIGLSWPAAVIFAAVWLATAIATRYSSLAALVASAATPIALALMQRPEVAAIFAVLAVVLWWKHRSNIARLAAGVESRIGAETRQPA